MKQSMGTVRRGKIHTDLPLKLKDGTRVLISESRRAISGYPDPDRPYSKAEIAMWLEQFKRLKPVGFDDDELQDIEEALGAVGKISMDATGGSFREDMSQ